MKYLNINILFIACYQLGQLQAGQVVPVSSSLSHRDCQRINAIVQSTIKKATSESSIKRQPSHPIKRPKPDIITLELSHSSITDMYECLACLKLFLSPRRLILHLQTADHAPHGLQDKIMIEMGARFKKDKSFFKCLLGPCKFKDMSRSHMLRHLNSVHLGKVNYCKSCNSTIPCTQKTTHPAKCRGELATVKDTAIKKEVLSSIPQSTSASDVLTSGLVTLEPPVPYASETITPELEPLFSDPLLFSDSTRVIDDSSTSTIHSPAWREAELLLAEQDTAGAASSRSYDEDNKFDGLLSEYFDPSEPAFNRMKSMFHTLIDTQL